MNRTLQHWLIIASSALTIGSGVAIAERSLIKSIDSILPDAKGITNFNRPRTITLIATNGQIIQKIGPATREKVESGDMPLIVKKAFIAAEDKRFYIHNGIDIWGILRAIVTNLSKGYVIEGASTITQQLARTIFLSQDRTITRKIKEAALALKLERQLSKERILEQYINNVYLGSGAYGIADASWVYFSKKPDNLSLSQVALIAGLAPAPSLYSPLVNREKAIKRRRVVLGRMFEEGYISEKELSNAVNSPLSLKPSTPKYFNSSAPFFSSWVERKLPDYLTKEQFEIGGLKVKTSLNPTFQAHAQKTIRELSPEGMEGALVSIEPSTGLVRAMIGGKNFKETQFNRATQALRSPGSTFKIFPYAAALNDGFKLTDKIIDTPRCWEGYCPKNFGDRYMGEVTLTTALKDSLNTVAVQLVEKIGFEKVISVANKLGVGNERKLGKYYPIAIGAYEQTLLEMTSAYAGIANRGVYNSPTPIEEIRGPNNLVIWSHKKNSSRGIKALEENVADTLNFMLEEVVSNGTGKFAALNDRPVAGKTGTSEGGRDLWFIGSIPQLSTGIWFGYDNNKETKSGSKEASLAWKNYMEKIKDEFIPKQFQRNRNQETSREKNKKGSNLINSESKKLKRETQILKNRLIPDSTQPEEIDFVPIFIEY